LWADFQHQNLNLLRPTLRVLAAGHVGGLLRDHHRDKDDFNLFKIDWNLAAIAGKNGNPLVNAELNQPVNPEQVAQAVENLNHGQREASMRL